MAQPLGTPRVVVLGGGFAGAYCARTLSRHAPVETLVIDRNNYFIFYPLLVEAGTGSLEPRHVVVSIRSMIGRAAFRLGEVVGLDTAARRVIIRIPELNRQEEVPYDHLVIALGSVTRMPAVPGLREHALEMKGMGDAIALRDRAVRMLELADAALDADTRRGLLHFVVVGGNFTGVEVAGELEALLRAARRRFSLIGPNDFRVTLVERGDRILQALGPELGDYAADRLRHRNVDVLLRDTVTAIEPDKVRLQSGGTIAARTVIWCAGIAPNPVLASMALPRDEGGWLVCERDLRIKGHDNIWGVGDCAVNPDGSGMGYPATAQHALREGVGAARNIARVLDGRPAVPCDIVNQGSLAALGCRTGVAQVFGVRIAGFPAWWLWRTVYLLKMPGLARKIRVATDWTLDLLFRRDYVQLGVHRADR